MIGQRESMISGTGGNDTFQIVFGSFQGLQYGIPSPPFFEATRELSKLVLEPNLRPHQLRHKG